MLGEEIQINKKYVVFYLACLLIGAANFGYFTAMCASNLTLDNIWYMLLIYTAELAGTILSGILYGVGKRMKTIFGNLVILGVSVAVMVCANLKDMNANLTYFLSMAIGFGIGIITVTVPFYLREVAPAEYRTKALLFFGLVYFLGVQIHDLLLYSMQNIFKTTRLWTIYIPMAALAFIQIALQLFVFRSDTPQWLAENAREESTITVLQQIYPNTERKLKEYSALKNTVAGKQNPGYRDLLSGENLIQLLKGALVVVARCATEDNLTLEVAPALNNTGIFLATFIGLIVIIVFGIFFVTSRLTTRKAMILGSIVLTLVVVGFLVFDIIDYKTEFPAYVNCMVGLIIAEWFIHGIIITPFSFAYVVKLLPERGFSLIMAFHWLGSLAIQIPYLLYLKHSDSFLFLVLMACYYIICAAAVLILVIKASKAPELDGGEEQVVEESGTQSSLTQ
eukprot:TRINITY_DN138_c0_g4_i4.p1 TRINITY_DN138_c0_g4~~TRINITY_DN138_c0_g4_i4.p1  ORF type:complete len:451 (+),score=102.73 TRINITY_DN138_c0_g4_i4:139-1491(+)